jgi:pimeloyl-ACP methyl ester carboxylesterase
MRKDIFTAELILLLGYLLTLTCVAQQLPPSKSKIDVDKTEYFGAYRISTNQVISISEGLDGVNLMYVDYHSGTGRTLYHLSEDTFFSGAGIMLKEPVTLKATFVRNGKGKVTKLRWQPSGEPESVALRIPFKEEQISFQNGDVMLSGTLITPPTSGSHPVVIIVPGANRTSRHLLRMYAHNFVSRGIAALVYDARGVGASTGSAGAGSFSDFANDVLAGVRLLKSRRNINPKQIGLFGFSNSAWTITLAASRSKDVAFIIPQVLSGVPPWQQEMFRVESQLRTDGFSEDVIQQAVAFMKLKYEVGRTGRDWEQLQAVTEKSRAEKWLPYTNPPRVLEVLRQTWRTQFSYDPLPAFEQITCPVLALWAGKDKLVPTEMSVSIINQSLKKAKNKDYTLLVFPTANHSMIEVETGASGEWSRSNGFAAGYWEMLTNWLLKRLEVKK